MALSGNTVVEVRDDGSDTNGGGFVPGGSGVDFSQQASPQLARIDAVTDGTTNVNTPTGGFTSDMVDNLMYLNGSWYQITAYVDTNNVTVDQAIGAASGLTMNVGGAFASPGGAGGMMWPGGAYGGGTGPSRLWVKEGDYSITSASQNVPGGCLGTYQYDDDVFVRSYAVTRGDRTALLPRLTVNVTGATMFQLGGARGSHLEGFDVDCNNQTSSAVTNGNNNSYSVMARVIGRNSSSHMFSGSNIYYEDCVSIDSGDRGFTTNSRIYRCFVFNAATIGISASSEIVNSGAFGCGSYGIHAGYFTSHIYNCIAANNTSSGFNAQMGINQCLSVGNGGYGFRLTGNSNTRSVARDLYSFGNTSGAYSVIGTYPYSVWDVTSLSANPLTDPGSGDYSLNDVEGGGKVLRADIRNLFNEGLFYHSPWFQWLKELPTGGGPSNRIFGSIF